MADKKKCLTLSWCLLILWLILIFSLSAQPATQSARLSSGLTELIIQTIGRVIPLEQLEHIVRKFAHAGAYLVLGVLMLNALKKSGIGGLKGFILSLLFCILYAVSDEIHQLFVPRRSGEIRDVLIDSAGAVLGTVLYKMVFFRVRGNNRV